ncbi:MAG: hypothetical protein H7836_17840, partial [Magnetococcus sp. YQC-3]
GISERCAVAYKTRRGAAITEGSPRKRGFRMKKKAIYVNQDLYNAIHSVKNANKATYEYVFYYGLQKMNDSYKPSWKQEKEDFV